MSGVYRAADHRLAQSQAALILHLVTPPGEGVGGEHDAGGFRWYELLYHHRRLTVS
jgi:hypothetical protein